VVDHEHELQDEIRETAPLKRLLMPALAVTGLLLVIAAIVITLLSISGRRQSNQVRNTLATLQRSVLQQQQSLAQVEREREALQKSYGSALGEQTRVTAERDQLSKQLATDSAGSSVLIEQIHETEKRLQKLEVESNGGQRIIEQYAPSVALLHVVVTFKHRAPARQ
jgi:uncharacterized protein (DUF3084 family)